MVAAGSEEQIRTLRSHIQELLDKNCQKQRFAFRLRGSDDVLQEGERVTFVVVPDREGVRPYDFATALADVETELARDEKEEGVLLVPAIPD